MYIHSLEIESLRSIRAATLELNYPGRKPAAAGRKPKLDNLNLLLGINGAGKTSILRAAAIAALGPLSELYIRPERYVRDEPGGRGDRKRKRASAQRTAIVKAKLALTPQDYAGKWTGRGVRELIASEARIHRFGDEEKLVFAGDGGSPMQQERAVRSTWEPIFQRESPAFLIVAYGASRRVEFDASIGLRTRDMPPRRQRVEGLFQEGYSMIPLNSWLPRHQARNPGRSRQVATLLNKLLPRGYRFTQEMAGEDYLFQVGKLRLPLKALSDGYKAFIGWVADLLYHIDFGCPSGRRLDENAGVVLIDEIDLHLHPEWQLSVLGHLAKTLPQLQFIVTSHSPLVTGSLEWRNIHFLHSSPATGETTVERIARPIHGLSADQILTSSFFGLESTRAHGKRRELEQMTARARAGDHEAADKVLEALTRGLEEKGEEYADLPDA